MVCLFFLLLLFFFPFCFCFVWHNRHVEPAARGLRRRRWPTAWETVRSTVDDDRKVGKKTHYAAVKTRKVKKKFKQKRAAAARRKCVGACVRLSARSHRQTTSITTSMTNGRRWLRGKQKRTFESFRPRRQTSRENQ